MQAELRNLAIARKREAAELRSKYLEEQNRRAAQTVMLDLCEDEAPTISTVRSPELSFSVNMVPADPADDEARQHLLTMSAEAERRLDNLLSRRRKLEALVRPAANAK